MIQSLAEYSESFTTTFRMTLETILHIIQCLWGNLRKNEDGWHVKSTTPLLTVTGNHE